MAAKKTNQLVLEPLESRLVLSAIWQGVDVDGDLLTVKLKGHGDLTVVTEEAGLGEQVTQIIVRNTGRGANLAVAARPYGGDGLVDVFSIDAGGENLRGVKINGYLGDLSAGSVRALDVAGNLIFEEPQTLWDVDGDLQILKSRSSLEDLTIDIDGQVKKAVVQGHMLAATMLVDSHLSKMVVFGDVAENTFVGIGGQTKAMVVDGFLEQSEVYNGGVMGKFIVGRDVIDSYIVSDVAIQRLIVDGGVLNSTIESGGYIGVVDVWNWIETSEINAGPGGIDLIWAYNISDTTINNEGIEPLIRLDAYTRNTYFEEIIIIEDDLWYWPVYDEV